MTTLSSLLRNSINEQLKKTCPEMFDPELPDYILLLLTNRKPKKEMIKELEVFLSPKQTRNLVEWLFQEIEILKQERKVPVASTKKTKEVKKEKKKKSKKERKKELSPISLSSGGGVESVHISRGHRERVKLRDEENKPKKSYTRKRSDSSLSVSPIRSMSRGNDRSSRHSKKVRRKSDSRSKSRSKRRTSSSSSFDSRSRSRSRSRMKKSKKSYRSRSRSLPRHQKSRLKHRSKSSSTDDTSNGKTSPEILLRKSPPKSEKRKLHTHIPKDDIKKKLKRGKSPIVKLVHIDDKDFGSPCGAKKLAFLPRNLQLPKKDFIINNEPILKPKRVINFKVLADGGLKMPDRNPFSPSEQSDGSFSDNQQNAEVERKVVTMKVSHEDLTESEKSSEKSLPKVFRDGKLQSDTKSELKLKTILQNKRKNREKSTDVKTLKDELDKQYPDPPSPKKDPNDSFGPILPPSNDKADKSSNSDLRRNVLISRTGERGESPVPTDSDDEHSKPESLITSKPVPPTKETPTNEDKQTNNVRPKKDKPREKDPTVLVETDLENNAIVAKKRSEKDILQDRLKQISPQISSVMSGFRAIKPNGRTQLHHMALNGDLYKLRSMLSSDDLTITDNKRTSVLHELAKGGFLFQVMPLILPAMLVLKDINNVTPLHECAKRSELFQLKTIDLSSINLNDTDTFLGKSLLHLCAERDDCEGVKMLLKFGADPTIKDKSDKFAHQLPKDMKITELLGGDPLAVTLRRKAETEMELRALKIEQIEAERKKKKNTIIRINPHKFPGSKALVRQPGAPWPPFTPPMPEQPKPIPQTAFPVSVPVPPPQQSIAISGANEAVTNSSLPARKASSESEKESNLVLPQDRKISLESRSSDDDSEDSDAESRGRRRRRKW